MKHHIIEVMHDLVVNIFTSGSLCIILFFFFWKLDSLNRGLSLMYLSRLNALKLKSYLRNDVVSLIFWLPRYAAFIQSLSLPILFHSLQSGVWVRWLKAHRNTSGYEFTRLHRVTENSLHPLRICLFNHQWPGWGETQWCMNLLPMGQGKWYGATCVLEVLLQKDFGHFRVRNITPPCIRVIIWPLGEEATILHQRTMTHIAAYNRNPPIKILNASIGIWYMIIYNTWHHRIIRIPTTIESGSCSTAHIGGFVIGLWVEESECLDHFSTREGNKILDWPCGDNVDQGPDCSDGSISNEESLIESLQKGMILLQSKSFYIVLNTFHSLQNLLVL